MNIVIIVFIAMVALCAAIVYYCKRNPKDIMSFRESLDLTDLPIVTFKIGGTKKPDGKFNFLLDTGCTISIIDKESSNLLPLTIVEGESSVYGMEGNEIACSMGALKLLYKDKPYIELFQIVDMSSAFKKLKAENGVTIHGVLGTKFFEKYKYVIDFNELIAYSKK